MSALCGLMQRVHAARGLRFTCDSNTAGVFAGAREDLEEMLGNLLDNAGKWAAHAVRVEVTALGGQLRITVADDGPGLPAEQLQRVLERGVRLDERASGSGLGLSIVADIAESYGGTLVLANDAPGLQATLTLPAG